MTKILVAGIGGVGGYIGGRLAKEFSGNPEVEVYFLVRGTHLAEIRSKGLNLVGPEGTERVHPTAAQDSVKNWEPMDYIILCTKNYSLDSVLDEVRPIVSSTTAFLPLQNGVGNTEVIQQAYPQNPVFKGCIHMTSRFIGPGEVQYFGNAPHLIFGVGEKARNAASAERLDALLRQSGISITLSDRIEQLVWEKFVLISTIATATTFFDTSLGAILEDPSRRSALEKLLDEVLQIAAANSVGLKPDFKELLLKRFEAIPYDATSSLYQDFKNQKPQTELSSLTGYIVEQGKKLGISTPTYEAMLPELAGR